MAKHGKLVLGVTLDDKEFDNKLLEMQKNAEKKKIDIKLSEENLQSETRALHGLETELQITQNEYDKINAKIQENKRIMAESSYIENGQRIVPSDTAEAYYRAQSEVESLNAKAVNVLDKIIETNTAIEKQEGVVARVNAKYEKQKSDLDIINIKMDTLGTKDISQQIEKASRSSNKMLNSIKRTGLAVFGIRSAYSAVRQIIGGVSAQNDKMGKQLEGIRNSLYASFTPVVEKIINLIKTLMAYINVIWRALFKKDLFKSVVEATSKTSKNLSSGAKSAKEINNQLSSFDEANVLSNNSSSGGGGGGIGSGADGGKIDLGLANIPTPQWLMNIKDFIEKHPKISKFVFGLAGFTLFGGFKVAAGLFTAITSILGGGSGAAATGLLGISSTLSLLTAAVWLITIDIIGITYVIDQINELNNMHETTKKHVEDNIKENDKLVTSNGNVLRSEQSTNEERKKAIDNIDTLAWGTKQLMDANTGGAQAQHKHRESLERTAKEMDNLYKSGKLTKEEQQKYYEMLRNQFNPMLSETYGFLSGDKEMTDDLRESFEKLDKKYGTEYNVKITAEGANKVKDAAKTISDAFSGLATKVQNAAQKMSSSLGQGIVDQIKKVFHADGGIVNMPGRGVPVHYAGEAGREGIVPIDNESQMALLGSEIAKRVVINLTNVNQMNGRTISRELARINSEGSFLSNS